MRYLCTLLVATITFLSFAQTPFDYTSFEGEELSLFSWEGEKIMLLTSSDELNATTISDFLVTMDAAYDYYTHCTGREPTYYHNVTYFNGLSTIAEVPSTCGAACGYLGWTGIEILTPYFDRVYNFLNDDGLYDHIPFYEFGRNFWFYGDKLKYEENDPVTTGFAVFMQYMIIEAIGVEGAPFGSWTFEGYKNMIIDKVYAYSADSSFNWHNTLGVGLGLPNTPGGEADLFASFCFYLNDYYCGSEWVENVWKFAEQRPNAVTTQDAVDNFVIASSQAANSDLVSLFKYWRWPVSSSAEAYIASLNLGIIELQPEDIALDLGEDAVFTVTSSDPNATYQWQIDSGNGFEDIEDSGQYSGAQTATLTVGAVNEDNHKNWFRCVISDDECGDISNIVRLTVNGVIGIADFEKEIDLVVYPNPTVDKAIISSPLANLKIDLLNIRGQVLESRKMDSEKMTLDMSHLSSGVYLIRVQTEAGTTVKKIIKQ